MPLDVDKTDLSKVRAKIETKFGAMNLEFFPNKAPNTVKNFVKLADSGFYNNLAFHRIVSGFMIQGGCPKGDGTGGPGYKIKAEFNDTKHERGVISMARSQQPDSAGCQFFICHAAASFLDGQYTAFGRIAPGDKESLATLDKIASQPVASSGFGGEVSKPKEKVVIEKISVELVP
jgi:peptidyl-prolyl cis-trans isomerase B (cyclophilin B)